MSVSKLLNRITPNLASQSNTKDGLLWDTAGRLSGMAVLAVTNNTPGPGQTSITIGSGSFVHNGIAVTETANKVLPPFATPAVFPLNQNILLIAQANGSDELNAPIYSLVSENAFNAIPDHRNYAAVIGIYQTKLTQPELFATLGLTSDGAVAWTPSVGGGHYKILNGADTNADYIQGAATNVDNIAIANLPSLQASTVKSIQASIVCTADDTNATIAAGTVTVAGVVANLDSFSVFLNGLEVNYIAGGAETPTTVAAALVALINAPGGGGYSTTATNLAGVITIPSVAKGQLGNFDLRVAATSATATITVTAPMTGGTQNYFELKYVGSAGGPASVPVNVYPVPSSTLDYTTFTVSAELLDFSGDTFNSMILVLTGKTNIVGPADFVRIKTLSFEVGYTESNNQIDIAPPTNLAHWFLSPSVAVGGGGDNSLAGHRLLEPIDHPPRSVDRPHIGLSAVGKDELDQPLVGPAYVAHAHIPGDGTLAGSPWLVTNDLSLKDVSDLVKEEGQLLADPTTGLNSAFKKDHNIVTGHHRSATYANDLAGTTGMQVRALTNAADTVETLGDAGLDPAGGDITKSQFFVKGAAADARNLDAAIYRRYVKAPVAGDAEVLGITSKSVADAGAGGKEIIAEFSTDGAKRFARFARTTAGLQAFYGVDSVNGVPASSLSSNRQALFSGGMVFCRTDVAPWSGRQAGADVYASMTAADTGPDGSGVATATAALNPHPPGCVLYAAPSKSADIESTLSIADLAFTPLSTWTGNWPAPTSFPANTFRDDVYNSQWLYLPFTHHAGLDKVEITATVYNSSRSNETSHSSSSNFGSTYVGMMAAPCWDTKEVIDVSGATLVAPVYKPSAPASPGEAFLKKSTGFIRRHPWVLTPAGLNRRNDGSDDGYYYDPRNGGAAPADYDPFAFFTRPLADYAAAPLARVTNLNAGTVSTLSYVKKGLLPFYDKRFAADTDKSGVLIDVSKIVIAEKVESLVSQANAAVAVTIATLKITISLRNVDGTYIGFPGETPPNGGPHGIAICPNRWDRGIVQGSPATGTLQTGGVSGYASANSFTKELPGFVQLDVTGIGFGQFTPLVQSL